MWRQLISLSNWRPILSATNQITNQIVTRSFSAFTAPQVATKTLTVLPASSLFRSSNILQPAPVLLSFERGFKVKGRLRRRCKDCYFVMREGRLYNICKTHPRHKQMSMVKKEKNTWILTDATQSKIRAW